EPTARPARNNRAITRATRLTLGGIRIEDAEHSRSTLRSGGWSLCASLAIARAVKEFMSDTSVTFPRERLREAGVEL
ncbi:MAG: hypothetical protein ACO2OQ_02275, partial [Thermofilaceae archaeon]